MKRIFGIASIVIVFSICCYLIASGFLTTQRMGEYKSLEEPQIEQYQQQVQQLNNNKTNKSTDKYQEELTTLKLEMKAFKATAKLQSTVEEIDLLLAELK